MKSGLTVVGVSLTFLMGLVLAPANALAGRPHGGAVGGHVIVGGRPFVGHSFVPHSIFPRPFVAHPFVPHVFFPRPFFPRHFFRPFVPFGVVAFPTVVVYAAPPVAYAPPPVAYAPPPSYDPSAYYAPPTAYSPPAAPVAPPPPMPTVVQYPTGRYELRGDGITTPYTWVWIPNPPPPPPPPAPSAPPAEPPASRDPSPPRHSQLYRWTDGEGVVHWTDRWDVVPQQYRKEARQTPPS